jgi:hypothetical protein
MNKRAIEIVSGYLPEIDRENPKARKLHLPRRVAVIFSSYHPDKTEMYFDSALFVSVVKVLLEAIPHQEMKFVVDKNPSKVLLSLEELQQYYAQNQAEDLVPFSSGELRSAGQTVAYLESIDYTPVGGSEPYHDSYTLSIYLSESDEKLCRQQIMEGLHRYKIAVQKTYSGNKVPQITLADRLKQLF